MSDDKPQTLSSAAVLNAAPPAPVPVYIPELKGHLYVKALTVAERDEIEGRALKGKTKSLRSLVFVKAVVHPDNLGPMFTERDIPRLEKQPAGIISRVADKAFDLAGMSDKDVEDEAEGFDEAPGADDSSD